MKNFFVHYQRRYDLDKLLAEYELENKGEDIIAQDSGTAID